MNNTFGGQGKVAHSMAILAHCTSTFIKAAKREVPHLEPGETYESNLLGFYICVSGLSGLLF